MAQANRSARRSDDVAEINSALELRVKELKASLKREQQQQFDLEEQVVLSLPFMPKAVANDELHDSS